MLYQTFFVAVVLAILSTSHAAPGSIPVRGRATDIICDGEQTTLTCYAPPKNTPQNVTVSDVAYIASYLRAYGAQTRSGRLFTQSAADAPNCAEWSLYAHNSALATAKHIRSGLNSSVLYSDIANTIDGGVGATAAQKAKAIIGCLTKGGSLGVQYNATNQAYNSSAPGSVYPKGYTPAGILIKIVSSNATAAAEADTASG